MRRTWAMTGAVMAAALLGGAGTAAAQSDVTVGVSETSQVLCPGFGGLQVVPGNAATAGFRNDPQALPKVGEVFYGAVVAGSIGGCADNAVGIEPVPPVGVELAISPQTPVRCSYASLAAPAAPVALPPESGCGQTTSQGLFGPNLLRGPGPGGTFPLVADSQRILTVEFPLRSSRPLIGSPSLACGRIVAVQPACRPDQAGDNLQVNVVSIDGGSNFLAPHIGLFVEPAAAGPEAESGAGTLALRSPQALRLRRAARRGVRLVLQVPAAGSSVTATLRAPGIGRVARAKRGNAAAGRLVLRVRPSRAGARALRRARPAQLTLKVRVLTPGGAEQGAGMRIRLRRG